MPRYFFDLHNDVVTKDPEGRELPDYEAAKAYALRAVRGLAADSATAGHLSINDRVEILDEQRQVIGSVRVGDAVEIRFN